jgi:hypothetical protein
MPDSDTWKPDLDFMSQANVRVSCPWKVEVSYQGGDIEEQRAYFRSS